MRAGDEQGRAREGVLGVAWLMLGVLVGVGGCGWLLVARVLVMFGVGDVWCWLWWCVG